MATDLRKKYPNIDALRAQGVPAEIIALAEQTKARLDGVYALYTLEASAFKTAQEQFTAKNYKGAMDTLIAAGMKEGNPLVVGLQTMIAGGVNSKAASSALAAVTPDMGILGVAGNLFGAGLGATQTVAATGTWLTTLFSKSPETMKIKPEQSNQIAAMFAGSVHTHMQGVEQKSLWEGVSALNWESLRYASAGLSWASNQAQSSFPWVWIQSAITYVSENLGYAIGSRKEPARSFDEIYAAYETRAAATREQTIDQAISASLRPNVDGAVLADLKASKVPDMVASWTVNPEASGLGAAKNPGEIPQNQRQEAGAAAAAAAGGTLTQLGNGIAGMVTVPAGWTAGRAAATGDAWKEGDGLSVIGNGALFLGAAATTVVGTAAAAVTTAGAVGAVAKTSQVALVGTRVWDRVPVIGGRQMPGLLQVINGIVTGIPKLAGAVIEGVGRIPDMAANKIEALSAKGWVAQQVDEAKAAMSKANPNATAKQIADAALKAEFEAAKTAAATLEEFAAKRVAEKNIVERLGGGLKNIMAQANNWVSELTTKASAAPVFKEVVTAPGKAAAAIGNMAAGAAAERGAADFANKMAGAPRAGAMMPRAVGTVGLGAIIAGGVTYATTGNANEAIHNAGEAFPVTGTIMAANQGRTVEAWIRGATDAGTAGTVLTSPLAVTGVGATIPTILGVGTLAFNEVARPVARVFGADVDPSLGEMAARSAVSLGEMAARSAVVELDAAGKRIEQRKAAEYTGAELRDGLLNNKSVIYTHFASEAAKQYDSTIAKLKVDNDGELPSMLPPSLRNRDSYVAARIDETLRLKAGVAAMDAPTGVKRLDLPTADEGIAAAADEIARERARATGLGNTGAKEAPGQTGKDLLSFVPDSISGDTPPNGARAVS